ncbi:hypothetical protein ACNQKP_13825 [Bdellovibrio bacteriovorus]|uniref:hypothetical protein n=1 Tax=Bdellovibrio bacteriovorus TaxID=959 RepID=UPI003AA9914D
MSFDEVSGAIKSRLESPIFGTFSIYLLIFNWRFFVIIFSELDYQGKLREGNRVLEDYFWTSFGWSLGLTIICILVLPILKEVYEKFLNWSGKRVAISANRLKREINLEDLNARESLSNVLKSKQVLQEIVNVCDGRIEEFGRYHQVNALSGNYTSEIKQGLENSLREVSARAKEMKKHIEDLQKYYSEKS